MVIMLKSLVECYHNLAKSWLSRPPCFMYPHAQGLFSVMCPPLHWLISAHAVSNHILRHKVIAEFLKMGDIRGKSTNASSLLPSVTSNM